MSVSSWVHAKPPSRQGLTMDSEIDKLATTVVDTAFHIHNDLGPGLFESVYETILEGELKARGLRVARQRLIDITYRGTLIPSAFKADLLIEDRLLIELKSVEHIAPVHAKQLLTYLRLMNLPIGFLINFGSASFRDGVKRVANTKAPLATWRLSVNPNDGEEKR
jgi:GxxExxY protein